MVDKSVSYFEHPKHANRGITNLLNAFDSIFLLFLDFAGFEKEVVMFNQMLFLGLLGLDFTKDGRYMALAERRNCKDFISVFVCEAWKMLQVCNFLLTFVF